MLSLLSGPFCSIVLCILAGIALRYALWFGSDSSESTADASTDGASSGRLQSLEQQLAIESDQRDTLQADYRQLCEEFDRYRQDATVRDNQARDALNQLQSELTEKASAAGGLQESTLQMQTELDAARSAQQELANQVEELADQLHQSQVATKQSDNELLQKLSASSSELAGARTELEKVRGQLEAATSRSLELEGHVDELQSTAGHANDNVELLQSELDTANAQHQEQIQVLEDSFNGQIGTLREELSVTNEAKLDLEARCATLATQLETLSHRETELGEHVAMLSADTRFVDDLRHQLTGLQAAYTQRTEEMHAVAAERDATAEQIGEIAARAEEAAARNAAAEDEIQRLQQELASAQSESESLVDERTALATSLQSLQSSSQEQLETTQLLVGEMQSEIASRHEELQQLTAENSTLVRELTTIRTRSKEELAVAYDRIQGLEQSLTKRLEEAQQGFQSHLTDREETFQQQLRLQETNAAVRFGALEAERTELREELERERLERAQAIDDEVALRTESLRNDSEHRLEALTSQFQTVADQLRDLQTEKEEVLNGLHREQDLRADLQAQLESTTARNLELETAQEAASSRVSQFERRFTMLTAELDDASSRLAVRDAAVGELRVENKELLAQLEREKQERSMLQRSLKIHSDTLEKLRADSASLETLLERQARVQSSLLENASLLHSANGTDDNEEVATAHSMEEPDFAAPREAEESVGVYSLHSGAVDPGITRIDPILGRVYATPPTMRDDLKLISGVAESLELKLNRLGIYQFEQIMRWDSHAVKEFSNILAFKDRIVRERWVEQAAEFYRQQYGIDRAA